MFTRIALTLVVTEHLPATYILVNIFNPRMPAVSAIVVLLAEHTAFWHAIPTDRLICAGKTVSFVVRNNFYTPHRRVLELHKQ